MRTDGRQLLELRTPRFHSGGFAISVSYDLILFSHRKPLASVNFEMGDTKVLAVVKGPSETANPRKSFFDSGFISVTVESDLPSRSASVRFFRLLTT